MTSDILRQDSKLYAVTLEDRLVCLDVKTGKFLWSFASGFSNPDFHFNSMPALAKDRIFFGGLNGILYALDTGSGKTLWKRDLGARISTSVIVAGDSVFAGAVNKHLYLVSAGEGTIVGDVTFDAEPGGRLVNAGGDVLLAFVGEKTLAVVALPGMKPRWIQKAAISWSSARPYVWNDFFLAGNDQGEIFAFRLTDGVAVWSETFEGVIRGIGSAAEILYVGTLKGLVYAWSPAATGIAPPSERHGQRLDKGSP